MVETRIIADLDGCDAIAPGWDALAQQCGMPQMAPAWTIAWLRHLAPRGAAVRIVAVHADERLVGVAPFYVVRGPHGRVDYALPGYELAVRLAPLALPGREWDVAAAIGDALCDASPAPDALVLSGLPLASHWTSALRDRWPGPLRPLALRTDVQPFLYADVRAPSLDAWLAQRRPKFRQEMRRLRRRFADAGGTIRGTDRDRLAEDVETFRRLHERRWRELGSSALAVHGERLATMLHEAGGELIAGERFRLWIAEIEGRPICANLCIAAGGVVLGINIGWDATWSRLSPPVLTILHAVEDALGRGEHRFELGFGDQAHKRPFATGDDPLTWSLLLPVGQRLPATLGRTLPAVGRRRLGRAARRALPPDQAQRLRVLADRVGRRR